MKSRIQKWGNSLALRIPKAFADEVGIADNAVVEIVLTDEKQILISLPPPTISLSDLLAGITADNIHAEIATDPAVGAEVW